MQQSEHVPHLLLLLSPPGCERIDRWGPSQSISGRKTSVLYLQWVKNQIGVVLSPLDPVQLKISHDKHFLASRFWSAVVQHSSAFPSITCFSRFFLPLTIIFLTPFIIKYHTIICNYRSSLWSLSKFPIAFSWIYVPQIPEFSFKLWHFAFYFKTILVF